MTKMVRVVAMEIAMIGPSQSDPINFYLDADGDGFGIETISEPVVPQTKVMATLKPKSAMVKDIDCDDSTLI